MFPYIMIIATMIFLNYNLHNKMIRFLSNLFNSKRELNIKENIIIKYKVKIITLSLIVFENTTTI